MSAFLDPDSPLDDTDVAILTSVAHIIDTIDPAPAGLAERIEFQLSLGALDAELARLTEAPVPVRGDGTVVANSITFTSSSMSLMILIDPEDGPTRIDAWVSGGGITVELIQAATHRSEISDVHGRLTWTDVPRTKTRFLIHPMAESGRSVLTPVLEL
ncbi:MAG: hypothetical protein ACK5KO_04500 [Arachnia sp.]